MRDGDDAMRHAKQAAAVLAALLAAGAAGQGHAARVEFTEKPGKVVVTVGGQAVATYVYADPGIPRPYFAHLRAPGGIPVTRNHPPVAGRDATDHATYHPGLWMAFGDLGGADFWRNKARVTHEGFAARPAGGEGRGGFAVRHAWRAPGKPERVLCREVCRITWHDLAQGYLLVWDSTFTAEGREATFGDQEEMGLGVRVATAMTEKAGGTIADADGRQTARRVWGEASAWCDYRGPSADGRTVGVALMAHPDNFRPSWWHARDYGLLVANPFGRNAFGKGEPSRVAVRPGESFRLRYGVLLHASRGAKGTDMASAYAAYLRLSAE
jgi:hypothetical protein